LLLVTPARIDDLFPGRHNVSHGLEFRLEYSLRTCAGLTHFYRTRSRQVVMLPRAPP
jgi:hypothetical protein